MGSAEGRAPESFVVDLSALGPAPLPLVGGKAVNLGKLTAAGFPVPRGFCLTTAAYRKAAPAGLEALAAHLDALASKTASDDVSLPHATPGQPEPGLGELARQAREMIVTAPIPADVDSAVRTAYAVMGSGATVAVRSSATAEDLPFASFAGQQDSFLDISGADAVVESVRRCWASLWTERAVAYRSAYGIGHRDVGLAVVVQDVVAATTAGVLFTANPVTGTRTQTVIDASAGPGQAVVSGSVNPDHFVTETATGRILLHSPDGTAAGRPRSLDDAQVRELTTLGDTVQRLFGTPQDVEWVIDAAGKIWLTQSRPITTLYPLPDPAAAQPLGAESSVAAEARVYLCGTLLQGLTRPLTPMGLSVLGSMGNRRGPWQYVNPGLRMFMDMTPMVRNKYGRRYLLRILPLADGRSAAVFPALLDDPRFGLRERPSRRTRPGAAGAPAPQRSAPQKPALHKPRTGGPAARRADGTATLALMLRVIPSLLRAVVRPAAELRRAFDYGTRLEAELVLPEPATPFGRLDHAQRILDRAVTGLILATLPGPAVGYLMLALARRLLRGIAEPRELEAVLRGLPNNVTTEMDLELWHLAVTIGANAASREVFLAHGPKELATLYAAGSLPAVAQTGLGVFLDRYGHRAVAEIDLGMPRWSEKPDHILGMISNYLHVEDPEQAPDRQFARAEEHAEARIRSLVERTRARSRLRARLVEFCLRRTRQLSGLRELPKFYVVLALAEMHRQLNAISTELARAGAITAADDVYFLEFDEVRVGLRGAGLKGIVAARRRLYDVELRRRRIPRVLLSDGTDVEAAVMAKSPASGALAGTPASAGTATGTVRVILDPVGAHLEPGEILVAPSTDPGWTPLFMTAGALVMEMGGVISHGAVVAREYGIPAVVGVPDATTRLRTGQRVTVDGSAGTVRQVDAPLSPATAAGSLAG
ncbi:PEP/pyruvate-binding domain-containing protein [Arthrobacter sp. ok362]|uniref:PEP/pyruvate-binding domain-containing protein n=1 Tax=Arthrobacter sp. ok362 TaxID=1761745 RepID=UPI000884A6C1|nr:PEP/pyruvate-binding domain-containing protein [Arthrobacter sp. ok362]SDL38914.1 pyruvate, water dikinase [Arthrobacter sp. ok362]